MTDGAERQTPDEFAKLLRKSMSISERRLWFALRNRRFAGLKFRRQFVIDRFVVDFACVELKLVVEVDGASHADRGEYDHRREKEIHSMDWNVVQCSNDDVIENLEGVLILIVTAAGLDAQRWFDGGYEQRSAE